MSHRADDIIRAIAAAVDAATSSSVKVEIHSRESIKLEEGQRAHISVDFGGDEPIAGDGSMYLDGDIESLLEINVTATYLGTSEQTVRETLLQLRGDIHRAIGPGRNNATIAALPYLIDTLYGGSQPPEVDTSADPILGELVNQWGVRYVMPRNDPQ